MKYLKNSRTYIDKYRSLLFKIDKLDAENKSLRKTINNDQLATQALLNSIPDTILVIDKDGNYIDVLCASESILVRPANELIGHNFKEFLSVELSQSCLDIIAKALEDNELKQLQYDLDIYGEKKYFEARVSPLSTDQVLFIIRDLTDTVHKKREIREKDDWFMNIFNASRDGFAVELNEVMIYVNEAFVKLYGFNSPEELIGKNISIIQAEESDEMMREFGLRRLRGEPVPGVYEAKGKCKDGTVIDIEVTASVFEVNGQKFIIDINRNISERKNFERRLREQNEQLQKINSELDRFVYSASHDLRAPLRSLLGLIQLFRIDNEEGRKEQYLQRMEKSINNLDNFIQDIINYSRNSRLELETEPIVLYDLINTIIEDLRYDASMHIPVYASYDTLLIVHTDKNRLSTILSNLISNAFRYHNQKIDNPFVKIEAEIKGDNIILKVEDNGIGIAEEHQDKIFQMFFRAHDKKVGSGLGLYIVKETITMLHGEISVESHLGKGTKFTITMPNYK